MELPKHVIDKFVESSKEHIRELDKLLKEIAKTSRDRSLYVLVSRLFHSFHGSSAMFGFADSGEVANIAEVLMNAIIEGATEMSAEELACFVKAREFIQEDIYGGKPEHDGAKELLINLHECLKIYSL